MAGDGITAGRQRSRANGSSAPVGGLRVERVWTTEGVHPYDEVDWERRDVVMTNWRDGSINFEQRGVEFPTFVERQRGEHRHHQVLPRRRRHARARVVAQAADRPRGQDVPQGGRGPRLLRQPGRRRAVRPRAHLDAAAPGVQLQLAGLVQRRHRVAAAGQRLLHPLGRRLDGLHPGLVQGGGADLQGRLRLRRQPVPDPVRPRSCSPPAARPAARSASCAARTPARAPSSPAAPPGARPRWSSSTSTTRTSRSSSPPRPARKTRSGRCGTPASTWTSAAPTSSACSTRTPTTRCGSATSSCGRTRRAAPFELRGRLHGEVIETDRRQEAVPRHRPGGVGVRRPGPAVRRHHQRLAHQPGDRADHRLEPVLGVHVAGRLVLQPRLAEPDEVPQGRRRLRGARSSSRASSSSSPRWTSRSASPTSRPRRSARPPGRTASSASGTPTSARC